VSIVRTAWGGFFGEILVADAGCGPQGNKANRKRMGYSLTGRDKRVFISFPLDRDRCRVRAVVVLSVGNLKGKQ